uniref:F5/8 type C domain-containing protein n=1 Tax=Macrostomum lignano TaxID=282301 RepID=A0A1I8HJ22_9PLAT
GGVTQSELAGWAKLPSSQAYRGLCTGGPRSRPCTSLATTPMDTCLSASDNDQWSYAEVPRAQSLFFTFSHPINVRKIVIYTRADCCKERARNLQIGLASPKHGNKYCNTDNTAFSYRRVISCHHDYVTLIVVKQRIASHLSLSIHFMTE